MKFRSIAALSALSVALSACVSGTDSTPASSNPTAGFQAQFNPDFGVLPFPNDLYSGTTGQLNIPGDAKLAANGPLLELNHLDGYGTQSDISVYFTSSIDPKSISGTDVIVLKVASSPTNKAVNPLGTVTKLTFGTDYSAEVSPGTDVNGTVLTIKPLKPLAPSTVNPSTHAVTFSTYLVIVTSGLKDTKGNAAAPSETFSKAEKADAPLLAGGTYVATGDATFDAAAQFTAPQLAVAAGAGVDPTTIAVTFSFSTEFLGLALGEIAATAAPTAQPTGVGIVDTGNSVCAVLFANGQVPGNTQPVCDGAVPGSFETEVFAGTVALPYYLTVPASGSSTALTDSWHNANGTDIALNVTDSTSFLPKATVAQNVIPILVALPKAGGPCTNGPSWPTVIFQHGITRNREDMFGIASGLVMGGAPTHCTAVVAIDLPLHGVTNTADPFYLKGFERTFDMDANGVAGATGSNIGGSGAQFINLNSTITSRDNLREGAADLINLVASLPNLHPATVAPLTPAVYGLDSTKVIFVGHSLGGIVGTVFLGADTAGAVINTSFLPKVKAAVLAMPGGHLAELLRQSPAFEPVIDAGLAKQGLAKGTQAYYDFYSQAQAVVEDGDPGNYANLAAGGALVGLPGTAGHPIHMIEVVGGADASSPPDLVVPNSATDVLIGQMGITTPITASALLPIGTPTLAQFTTGGHSSILSPAAPSNSSAAVQLEFGAVTVEMQKETGSVVISTLAGAPGVAVSSNTFLSATLKQ